MTFDHDNYKTLLYICMCLIDPFGENEIDRLICLHEIINHSTTGQEHWCCRQEELLREEFHPK